jgi:D-glycero-alpha-D-manno-heptose-7-phosphate kinase
MLKSHDRRAVLAQASCRADLAGGTLDLWPLYLFHPGALTLNFALNILTRCRIEPRPGRTIQFRSLDTGREETFADIDEVCCAKSFRHPIAGYLVRYFAQDLAGQKPASTHGQRPASTQGFLVETQSESPAGAGISGSSALMIATTAALARYTGRKIDCEQMRVIAQNVEAQIIAVPTGCQDYYPALYGGVNAIRLGVDGVHREAVAVAPEDIDARFILVYTGAPRQSGINNWEVFNRHVNGDRKVVRNFENISAVAQAMHAALLKADWDEVGRLLREEWRMRRANYPGISSPLIDKLMRAAQRNGGRGAKVCGAGGGGCVIFMAKDGEKERVTEALRAAGGQVLPFRVAREGVSVTSVAAAAEDGR